MSFSFRDLPRVGLEELRDPVWVQPTKLSGHLHGSLVHPPSLPGTLAEIHYESDDFMLDVNDPAIWWQVIPVLVTSQSDWPNQAGTTGITTFEKLQAAQAAGTAIPATSNFFLFFSSKVDGGHSMKMN
jgi:hypothetical protein